MPRIAPPPRVRFRRSRRFSAESLFPLFPRFRRNRENVVSSCDAILRYHLRYRLARLADERLEFPSATHRAHRCDTPRASSQRDTQGVCLQRFWRRFAACATQLFCFSGKSLFRGTRRGAATLVSPPSSLYTPRATFPPGFATFSARPRTNPYFGAPL